MAADRRAEARDLLLQGLGVADVAARMGVRVPNVHAWIAALRASDAAFLQAYPRQRLPRAEAVKRHQAIRDMASKGKSRRQVAKALGLDFAQVQSAERHARQSGKPIAFGIDKCGRKPHARQRFRVLQMHADAFAAMSETGDWQDMVKRILAVLAGEPVLVKNLLEDV